MRFFLILYGIFLLAGGLLLLLFTKEDIFLYVNAKHTEPGDFFFPAITHLGHGAFSVFVILIFIFLRYRSAIIGITAFLLSGAIVQFLKRWVYMDEHRPVKFFEGIENIYVIPGVDIAQYNSFPSGHSATVFSMCCFLALIIHADTKWKHLYSGILFLLAIMVAFSRVYTAQHFFGDIYTGSVIGVLVTLLVYKYFNASTFNQYAWMNSNILKSFSTKQ